MKHYIFTDDWDGVMLGLTVTANTEEEALEYAKTWLFDEAQTADVRAMEVDRVDLTAKEARQ